MNFTEIMKQNKGYCSKYTDMPSELQQKAKELQQKAKELCWKYNQTGPSEGEKRSSILKELFGTYHPLTFIEPSFRCDYGFIIHTHGLTAINYNCVYLDG
ncbi:maltose acetyltransferase domain-containing protein [Clostridium sp.]|uniref:maltose acetyltransferase domain-containing protein n=1 Tax=Clostridium sp. TaxID=1506 RepID=UPI0034598E1B